jgi:putative FmdB family regulatory protein
MPTYQYQCDACGQPLEVVQSFTDDALTICPSCSAPDLRKVYGSVGVVFKGSGFYRTDSRSTSDTGSTGNKDSAAPAAPSTSAAPAAPSTSAAPAKTSTPSSSTKKTTSPAKPTK